VTVSFSSALIVFAHPDDAEFMCGGTVAAWANEGTDVHYCVVTDGSAGNNEPGQTRDTIRPVREAEQRAAAEVLGVKSVTFLGFVDGELEVNLETRKAVTRVVRRIRPEVVVAPDPSRLWFANRYINHWDHKQAGMLALCAPMKLGLAGEGDQAPDVVRMIYSKANAAQALRVFNADATQARQAALNHVLKGT